MTRTIAQVQGPNKTLQKQQVELPALTPAHALVKVSHVAQNPTDVQSLDFDLFGEGAVLGCDFAGTVEKTGPECQQIQKGDRVAGLIWGGEVKGLGGYSEHTILDEKISFKIPSSISSEAAATIPLAACTAWLALFSKDCLSIPQDHASRAVLVWGGSSSVGAYTVQLAHLFNLTVIATCSPKNFDVVKGYGADHVFDYNDAGVVAKIKAVAPTLEFVFDTIGSKTSSGLAAQAVTGQGVICTVRPGKANTEDVPSNVKVTDVLVWTAFLKDHSYKEFKWPASKEDHQLAIELFRQLPDWLAEGKVRPNQVKLLRGLDAVPEGFQMYRDGVISSFKIVYAV